MEQGNNNPDEKLRQEISMLSRLIASGGQAPGPQSSSRTSTIIPSTSYAQPYLHHHQYQRPLSFVNSSSSNDTGWTNNVRSHLPQYTNPFRLKLMQDHASKIFPTSYQISTGPVSAKVQKDHGKDSYCVASYSHAKSTNPFKVVRNQAKKVVLGPSFGTPASSIVNRDIVLEPAVPLSSSSSKAMANVPTSVYINPALLLSSSSKSCQESSSNVSKSSFIIRPHINPDHFAYRQLPTISVAGSSGTSTASSGKGSGCSDLPIVSSSVIRLRDHSRSLGLTSLNSGHDQCLNRQPVIKSKYKVDRRRKHSYSKAESPKRALLNSRRMKIVKKYSTRFVPQPSPSVLSRRNLNPHSFKRSSLHHLQKEFNQLTRLTNNYSRSLKGAYRRTVSKRTPHSPKKGIVRIGGNKYLRKNSGMTLKKIKQRSPAVLNIGGSHFISKNSGKSLKRLSRPKSLSISLSQTPATPGVRLAHRAVIKSKVTLSQRTWRKKRFCVYYNQLGVCKKNEEGSCPFVHDKKQLSICPKFIVGKCTVSDCKLSHDINVGRMPPCQFFNKSECSRENCPYPHIKTTTFKRKSSGCEIIDKKDDKDSPQKCPGTPRKRKTPTKRERTPNQSKSKKSKQEDPKEQGKPKSRYYDQSPASQPIISIIPRRIRPVSEDPSTVQKPSDGSHDDNNSNNAIHVESNQAAQPQVETLASPKSLQRARLMKKVSRLQEKVKPKESTAPQFLSFK